jgi:hypothetical protein
VAGELPSYWGKGVVFQDDLFLVEKRWLMASQGNLPEAKYSLEGLPGSSQGG